MAQIIQIRRDTAALWASANPVVAEGEFAFETDTRRMKIGDGIQNYNALLYWPDELEQDNYGRLFAFMGV